MTRKEEVRKLAALARIELAEAELDKFAAEFDAIVAYVDQLKTLDVPASGARALRLKNVLRDDGTPHPPRAYTEELVTQFPARAGDALLVKQIISHDRTAE